MRKKQHTYSTHLHGCKNAVVHSLTHWSWRLRQRKCFKCMPLHLNGRQNLWLRAVGSAERWVGLARTAQPLEHSTLEHFNIFGLQFVDGLQCIHTLKCTFSYSHTHTRTYVKGVRVCCNFTACRGCRNGQRADRTSNRMNFRCGCAHMHTCGIKLVQNWWDFF